MIIYDFKSSGYYSQQCKFKKKKNYYSSQISIFWLFQQYKKVTASTVPGGLYVFNLIKTHTVFQRAQYFLTAQFDEKKIVSQQLSNEQKSDIWCSKSPPADILGFKKKNNNNLYKWYIKTENFLLGMPNRMRGARGRTQRKET